MDQRIQNLKARQALIQSKLGEEVGGAGLIDEYLKQSLLKSLSIVAILPDVESDVGSGREVARWQ